MFGYFKRRKAEEKEWEEKKRAEDLAFQKEPWKYHHKRPEFIGVKTRPLREIMADPYMKGWFFITMRDRCLIDPSLLLERMSRGELTDAEMQIVNYVQYMVALRVKEKTPLPGGVKV